MKRISVRGIVLTAAVAALMPAACYAIDKAEVEKVIRTEVKSVEPSPIPGIFEVVTGDNKIVYIEEKGRYLLVGNLLDMQDRVNITQNRMDEISKVDFSALPLDKAVIQGDGEIKIAVFDDPDCPYCRKLHTELKKLKNAKLYYFLFNLPMHPKAYEKSKKILCAEDKLAALDKAMNGDALDDLKECETDLVDKNKELAGQMGVSGTPHMILESGVPIRGFKDASELQKIVDDEVAKKKGAAKP